MKAKKVSFAFKTKINGVVKKYHSRSVIRFRNHLRTTLSQNSDFSVYLKVKYGNGYDNAGVYESREDILFALEAFADSAITKYLYE